MIPAFDALAPDLVWRTNALSRGEWYKSPSLLSMTQVIMSAGYIDTPVALLRMRVRASLLKSASHIISVPSTEHFSPHDLGNSSR
jgi:hypothetical protein